MFFILSMQTIDYIDNLRGVFSEKRISERAEQI